MKGGRKFVDIYSLTDIFNKINKLIFIYEKKNLCQKLLRYYSKYKTELHQHYIIYFLLINTWFTL